MIFSTYYRYQFMQSNISLNHDEELTIGIVQKSPKPKSKIPLYSNFGRGGRSSGGVEGINAALVFAKLSNSATWLFWTLVNIRDYSTNVCKFHTSALSNAEKLKLTRAYKELHELGLIQRIKKEHYLINPKIILPDFERYASIQQLWDENQTKSNFTI